MTSSIPSTPRSNHSSKTPSRTPRRLCRRALPPETPDYLSHTVRTPITPRRRGCKDKSTEISNGLTVAVRVRPMNNRELSCTAVYDTVSVKNNELTVRAMTAGCVTVGITHTFQYDHVFWSSEPGRPGHASQQHVFEALGAPLIDSAFSGYNACLLAYGQTGSGKSYSMMGDQSGLDVEQSETAGIIPRFCYELFSRIARLPAETAATVEISYFEIYNEKIYDLLAGPVSMTGLDRRTPLKIREHPVWGPYVVNLSPHVAKSFAELRHLLQAGNKYRATGATCMNDKSSRSHSIVSIELSVSEVDGQGVDSGRRSKISLVDLAGSERVGSTGSSDGRHKEGVSINQSLLTLGKVIAALADPRRTSSFVPYRESTLTWLLRESLGGNSLTAMLATITPASSHVDETLATLRYACQARSIVNRAYVNENPHDRLIRELRAEVERLRALRQDCERQSMARAPDVPDTSAQELAELRDRLSATEHNLKAAQTLWEEKFLEARQRQLEELRQAEHQKQELESRVRVLGYMDRTVEISPYKSDFLQQLEDVINGKDEGERDRLQALIEDTNEWCANHSLSAKFAYDAGAKKIFATDAYGGLHATCLTAHLENRQFYNSFPEDFLNCLHWQTNENCSANARCIVYKYMQQMRNIMTAMEAAVEEDEQLRPAYWQLNSAVRNFDKAVHSGKAQPNSNKSVPFECDELI